MIDLPILKCLSLSLWVQNKFHPDFVYFYIFNKIGLPVKTSDLEQKDKKKKDKLKCVWKIIMW